MGSPWLAQPREPNKGGGGLGNRLGAPPPLPGVAMDPGSWSKKDARRVPGAPILPHNSIWRRSRTTGKKTILIPLSCSFPGVRLHHFFFNITSFLLIAGDFCYIFFLRRPELVPGCNHSIERFGEMKMQTPKIVHACTRIHYVYAGSVGIANLTYLILFCSISSCPVVVALYSSEPGVTHLPTICCKTSLSVVRVGGSQYVAVSL